MYFDPQINFPSTEQARVFALRACEIEQEALEASELAGKAYKKANDAARHASFQQYKIVDEFSRMAFKTWIHVAIDEKSATEQQELLRQIDSAIRYTKRGGRWQEHEVAARIMKETFGDETIEKIGDKLFLSKLENLIDERFQSVSPVWRSEPKSTGNWRKDYEREHSWEEFSRDNPPIHVTAEVFAVLEANNRIKPNGTEWMRACGCGYSFKNAETIATDIANAATIVDERGH